MENKIVIAGRSYPKEDGVEYLMSKQEMYDNVQGLRSVYMPELANKQNLEKEQKMTIK